MKLKEFKSLKDLEEEIDAYLKITSKTSKKIEDLPPYVVLHEKLKNTGLLPKSDKNSKTKQKFNDHFAYKTLVNNLNYPNGNNDIKYDTWYKDTFYGRIDYKNNVIYHNYWIFQNISSNPATDICVFDFVADAFDRMKQIFNKKKKSSTSPFLQTLEAKRGNSSTINPEIKYQQYINNKFQEFLTRNNVELRNSKKIKNFNDFKNIFINNLKNEEGILTFQGFFDKINVDIYDSYLAFDIYDDRDNPSDSLKLSFLEDPNYNSYESAARQAGFFVDQNKPWRLVADLQSKSIVEALKRRYAVAEELIKTKKSVYAAIKVGQISWKGASPVSIYFPTNEALKLITLGNKLQDKKEILNFTDYFRKEIPGLENFLKNIKDVFTTYVDKDVKFPTNLTINSVKFGKEEIETSDPILPKYNKNLFNVASSLLNICFVLAENKTIVDFIFQSLEDQLKTLETINKPIDLITNEDVYSAIYCQVSDYAFFTYLPKKLQEFYNKFLEQEGKGFSSYYPQKIKNKSHDSYVTFSKTSDGKTKAVYNKREPLNEEKIKLSNNLQNDFYVIDFLIDHLEYRLFEEKKVVSEQVKNDIINQAKVLYEKSLIEYKIGNDYLYYRNLAMNLIELYIFNLSSKKAEPKNLKKIPFIAQQYFYKTPRTEPVTSLERICLTLPERGDIIVEQEVCGKFESISGIKEDPSLEIKAPGPGDKKQNLNVGAPCKFTQDCKTGLTCLGGVCQVPKQEVGKAPIAGSGAKKGDIGIMPPNNKCTFDEDCNPKSCYGSVVVKCVKSNPSDKEGQCQCKEK